MKELEGAITALAQLPGYLLDSGGDIYEGVASLGDAELVDKVIIDGFMHVDTLGSEKIRTRQ